MPKKRHAGQFAPRKDKPKRKRSSGACPCQKRRCKTCQGCTRVGCAQACTCPSTAAPTLPRTEPPALREPRDSPTPRHVSTADALEALGVDEKTARAIDRSEETSGLCGRAVGQRYHDTAVKNTVLSVVETLLAKLYRRRAWPHMLESLAKMLLERAANHASKNVRSPLRPKPKQSTQDVDVTPNQELCPRAPRPGEPEPGAVLGGLQGARTVLLLTHHSYSTVCAAGVHVHVTLNIAERAIRRQGGSSIGDGAQILVLPQVSHGPWPCPDARHS